MVLNFSQCTKIKSNFVKIFFKRKTYAKIIYKPRPIKHLRIN